MSNGEKRRLNGELGKEGDDDDEMDDDGDGLEVWERTYVPMIALEALQEDESGLLRSIDNKATYHAQYRRRIRNLSASSASTSIQKGLIRYLYIVIDLSRAAAEMDLRPSTMAVVVAKM